MKNAMTHHTLAKSLPVRTAFASVALVFAALTTSGQPTGRSQANRAPVVLSFCDLVENANRYVGQKVQIQATYMYGFEVAELYCLRCVETKVWVEFDDAFEKYSNSRERNRIKPNGDVGRTVNISAVGVLYAGGFGHLGVYPLKFVITSLKRADVIANQELPPQSLSVEQRKKLCKK